MDTTRHSGIFSAAGWSVCLIGVGGIGSPTGIALAKMGIEDLTIYDKDIVEEVNVSCQMHGPSFVGTDKVLSEEHIINLLSGLRAKGIYDVVDESTQLAGHHIIISAVDTIAARRQIWEAVKKSHCFYYLDARMGSEVFQVLSVDMKETKWYESMLYAVSDGDVPDEPCTSKATIYTAFFAAGHIGRIVRLILTGDFAPGIVSHDIRTGYLSEMPLYPPNRKD